MSGFRIISRVGVAALGAGLIAALLTLNAAPALAHNSVIGTVPAAGAVVTAQPTLISVTTSDSLENFPQSTGMQISGPAGAAPPLYYGDGCATVFGPTLETEAQLGEPGDYTVVWQVVSADGHTISGDFTFTWQPDAAQTRAAGSPTPQNCAGVNAGSTQAPPTDAAAPGASGSNDGMLSDVLWIGGAVAAVIVATLVTLLVLGRRKPKHPN
ncbi:copper resistance CopC family protein [Glaciibacter psychrotolerans]|uniref:CopC domain-containing protein n=1 Tax=Glaciibacter psychrotolerans TaxID=670054 RepID=A0A7Z0J7F0_9MICO|nr:copper resistance CopC family protein [Leifsonia psychrotolerans]NYJ21395.1 hypothetical protein [Leifsonia psychrotolerans]